MAGSRIKNFPTSPDQFSQHYDNVNEIINAGDVNNVQDAIIDTQAHVINKSNQLAAHEADFETLKLRTIGGVY
jgi:hypothetical protein